MKKMIRKFVIGLTIISIISVILVFVWISKSESKSDLSNIIMAIASVINIVFILGFYIFDYIIRTKKEKEEDKEKEDNLKRENKVYWYRAFVLEKNIPDITRFFNYCNEIIDEINIIKEDSKKNNRLDNYNKQKVEITNKYFERFNKQYGIMSIDIISMSEILSVKLSNELSEIFQETETLFSEELSNFIDDLGQAQYSKIKFDLNEQKKKIIKIFYDYGVENKYI